MKAKHLILAAALVSLSLGGCRKGSDSGDEKEPEKDTVNYRLKDVPDEDILEEEIVEEIVLTDEEQGTPHITELRIVPDEEAKKESKKESKESSREMQREVVAESPAPAKEEPRHDAILDMVIVEQKPSFPGGDAALIKWLGNNIVYPADAAEEGMQGRVVVSFIVEKDGSISNVQAVRKKYPSLDAEAVRVARSMPRWQPARNNGQPVRVKYNLPVTFKLQQ